MKNKILSFALLCYFVTIFSFTGFSQSQVQIGTGTATDQRLPIEPWYNYTYSQVIYLQSEISTAGNIIELKWDFAGSSLSNSNDWTIYIGHTSKTSFSSSSDWVDVSLLMQVWSGTFADPGTSGWITFDITDFYYNNSDNLIIAVDENAPGDNGSSDDFNCSSVGSYRGLTEYGNSNINPASPPSGSRKQYIANIILEINATSCPAPSGLTETNISQTSADLGWTENGTATTWDIEWGAAGFTLGSGTTITGVTSNPYPLSGLTAGTEYQWYIRSDCGGTQSAWNGPGSFTTLAPIQSMPFTEDWETGIIGSAWNYHTGSNATLQVNTVSKHNGTYGLEQYGDGGSYTTPSGLADAYAKAQPGGVNESHTSWNSFTVDLTTASSPSFLFWYSLGYSWNNNYNFFWVQIDAGAGWVDLFATQPDDSAIPYEEKTFDLSAYTGGTVIIRFFHNGKYDNDYLYLDDISVAEFTCPNPTDQTVSNITTTSVNLGWTENGTSTAWDIEWGAAGFTQGTGTTITGTSTNPHTLSGLSANTAYDWYVRSDCGGGSSSNWTGPHTFSTTINSFPWTEDFENSGDIPYGWSQEYVSGTHNWIFHTGGHNNNNPSTAHSGTYNACFDHTSTGTKTKLVTPQFDLSGKSNPQLSFWHTQASWEGDQDELRVYYKTTSGGTWILIPGAVFTSSITSWTQETFNLPSPSSTYYIAFEGLDGYGYGVCVDDVEVSVSSCPAPTGLFADNISQTSVDLNWTTGGATTWNIEWGATGFTQGAGTMITGTTSNPYPLSGLTAGTTYDFYVQDDCGGGSQSSWSGPASFTTLCNAITVFPWTEDFENAGSRPDCWTEEYNVGSHDWVFQDGGDTDPFSAHGGSYNAAFIHQSTGSSTKLITPQLDLSGLTNSQVSFWYAQAEDNGDQDELRVYYKTNQGGPWTLIPGAEYTSNVPDWTQVILNLPSANATYFVAFEGTDGCGQGVCIDDVVVDGTISCLPPTDLYADNIDTSSVSLNWTTGGAALWNIEWDTTGFIKGTGTTITGTTTNPHYLSGLTANTIYDFYVQDDCGSGSQSIWTGPNTFCTAIDSFPWNENFENGGNRPICWTEEYVTGWKDWDFRTGGISNEPPNAHGGTYNASFDPGNVGYKTRLITPTFDISSLTTPKLKFWYTQAAWQGYQNTLRIYYKTTHGGTWTLMPGGEFTTSITEWTEVILSLPLPSATYQIAFEGTDGGGLSICIDDVRVYDNLPMIWVSSTCTQNTDYCYRASFQQIIGIEIEALHPISPIEVTTFRVNMNGSTSSLNELVDLRIYYTGNSPQYNTSNRFNPDAYFPSSLPVNFDVTGSQTLAEGTNYFWLTVNVEDNAINGETVDAECIQITTSAKTDYTPTITAPAGSRTIHADMQWTGAVSSDWNNASNWDPAGPPDSYIPIDITSGTPNNLQLNGELVIRGTGGVYNCFSLDIQPSVTVTNSYEFYIFGDMVVSGTYTSTYNSSYPHMIYGGGSLKIGMDGFVAIGNTVNGEADLRIGHSTSSGGTLDLQSGGWLNVADQIYLHDNANVIANNNATIWAGKGGGGSAYSADNPATLYVENGATGNINNTTIKVCGKETGGYYSVNILSPDFDFNLSSTLEICHGDYATHYNSNVNIVNGADLANFIVNKPGNTVTVESNLNLSRNFTVRPESQLTLETGNTISTNQNFLLESNNSGTASFINNGTLTFLAKGSATVEQYIPQYVGSAGWHFLSSPVSLQAVQTEFVSNPPAANDDFYFWDETTNLWINSKNGAGAWNTGFDDNLVVGKGYMVAYSTDVTKNFTGILNNAAVSPSVSYTAGQGDGWNLVGNPFPSAIDWDNAGWTKTNISGSVYVYDGVAGQYKSWNGTTGDLTDGIVPPMNGMFVEATGSAPALTIPLSARTHGTQSFYKNGELLLTNHLVIEVAGNGYSDKTFIHFRDDATNGWDNHFDAYKLKGINEAPQLYSFVDEISASINSNPFDQEQEEVFLGMEAGVEGDYTLSASGMETFYSNMQINLYDLKEGNVQDLRYNSSYQFFASPEDDAQRFKLIFYDPAFNVNEIYNQEVKILISDNQIYIDFTSPKAANVELFNLNGQLLYSKNFNPSSTHTIKLNHKGFLILSIRTEKNVITKKIFVI